MERTKKKRLLWEEHEQFLRGSWLVTKNSPPLMYQFAKYDEKEQLKVEKDEKERAKVKPAARFLAP